MSNVYLTPFELRDAIHEVFPNAEIEGEVSDNKFALRCTLFPGSQPVSIERAIDALQLNPALNSLFQRVRFETAQENPTDTLTLDIERFSLAIPLTNWQNFQRRAFEEAGNNCEDLLIEYLRGDEAALKKLELLGLAPNQLNDPTEEDREIFTKATEKLLAVNPTSNILAIAKFKNEYPALYTLHITPFDVRDAIQSVFPSAQIEGIIVNGEFALKCTLVPKASSFTISRVLDAQRFEEALKALPQEIPTDQLMGDVTMDASPFSQETPLRDWQSFQRVRFVEAGGNCEELLLQYLKDKTDILESLENLGLAPSQLKDGYSESDLLIFRALCPKNPSS